MPKIYLGADHNGFKLKEKIKKYLKTKNINYKDLGNHRLDPLDDYPDFAYKVAQKVKKGKNNMGILVCGSSHGVCITANKIKGIRAAEISTIKDAKFARADTDCNIMCLGGWKIKSFQKVKRIIDTWLNTPFSKATRHQRRINKITRIEKNTK